MKEEIFIQFPNTKEGNKDRKDFYLSEDGLTLISEWRKDGLSQKRIAERMGINETQLRAWAKNDGYLNQALIFGREIATAKVEMSLYKRAIGYDYIESTEELVEGQMLETKRVKKHVSPDVKAALAWLYNHKGNIWRALQEPTDSMRNKIDNAKKILVSIKELATTGESQEVDTGNEKDE
jgi:transcriptional regulator with XRE-family HTH domain